MRSSQLWTIPIHRRLRRDPPGGEHVRCAHAGHPSRVTPARSSAGPHGLGADVRRWSGDVPGWATMYRGHGEKNSRRTTRRPRSSTPRPGLPAGAGPDTSRQIGRRPRPNRQGCSPQHDRLARWSATALSSAPLIVSGPIELPPSGYGRSARRIGPSRRSARTPSGGCGKLPGRSPQRPGPLYGQVEQVCVRPEAPGPPRRPRRKTERVKQARVQRLACTRTGRGR